MKVYPYKQYINYNISNWYIRNFIKEVNGKTTFVIEIDDEPCRISCSKTYKVKLNFTINHDYENEKYPLNTDKLSFTKIDNSKRLYLFTKNVKIKGKVYKVLFGMFPDNVDYKKVFNIYDERIDIEKSLLITLDEVYKKITEKLDTTDLIKEINVSKANSIFCKDNILYHSLAEYLKVFYDNSIKNVDEIKKGEILYHYRDSPIKITSDIFKKNILNTPSLWIQFEYLEGDLAKKKDFLSLAYFGIGFKNNIFIFKDIDIADEYSKLNPIYLNELLILSLRSDNNKKFLTQDEIESYPEKTINIHTAEFIEFIRLKYMT